MNFSRRRLLADVRYSLIQFTRSRQAIFFALIMPILFLILGWFLFGVPMGRAYVDFLIPGILGIAVMGSAVDLTVGVIAGHRASGLFRKIVTTPVTRLEWNMSRAIAGICVAAFSTLAALAAAWMAFGYLPPVNVEIVLLVIAGSVMAVGIGMLIAHLVRDREAANMAAFTVTFPLILVSGSIFPMEQLPGFLKMIGAISPLTYLNEGLRNAMMAGGSQAEVFTSLSIVAVLGISLFIIGVFTLRWRDG